MSHDNQVFGGRKTDGRTYGRADLTTLIVVFRKVLWMRMEVKHLLYVFFCLSFMDIKIIKQKNYKAPDLLRHVYV
jgi:hypothetical protein